MKILKRIIAAAVCLVMTAGFFTGGVKAGFKDLVLSAFALGETAEPADESGIREIAIKNYHKTLEVDYNSTVIFHTAEDAPKGYEIVWSNGAKGTKCGFTAFNSEYIIYANLVNSSTGKTVKSTDSVTVTVNTGFFAKVIAFFRALFGMTRVYEDFYNGKNPEESKKTGTELFSSVTRLKYGVVLNRTIKVYYEMDMNGKITVTGEEVIKENYDRSAYSAGYSDLLPAARVNANTYKDYISEVLRITNAMRAEGGIAPLTLDNKLTEQANVRAEEVAWSGLHSHTRPNMKSYSSLFIENGYTTGTAGENIGWYQTDPAEVCRMWKESPTHYKNIMNPAYTKIGIGVAPEADPSKGLCWVQHFYGA